MPLLPPTLLGQLGLQKQLVLLWQPGLNELFDCGLVEHRGRDVSVEHSSLVGTVLRSSNGREHFGRYGLLHRPFVSSKSCFCSLMFSHFLGRQFFDWGETQVGEHVVVVDHMALLSSGEATSFSDVSLLHGLE